MYKVVRGPPAMTQPERIPRWIGISHSIRVRPSEEETAAFQVMQVDRPYTLMAAM
jgi:hypothetical protein